MAAITKSITVAAEAPATVAASGFPKVMVATVGSLQVNTPVTFNYPLDNEPSILVKVGQKAQGGVGPEGDIVAFSNVCQHLGCVYGFQAPGTSPPCDTSLRREDTPGLLLLPRQPVRLPHRRHGDRRARAQAGPPSDTRGGLLRKHLCHRDEPAHHIRARHGGV